MRPQTKSLLYLNLNDMMLDVLTNEDLKSTRERLDGYFHFGISVDCVVFGYDGNQLQVLVIERGAEPFAGYEAIPGDLVHPNEDIDAASKRVLHDLTGLPEIYLEQLKTFGAVHRHPMGRVVTVAYYALLDKNLYRPKPSSWASEAYWKDLNDLGEMAFDHREIVETAIEHLRYKVQHQPLGFELLPEEFTLAELQLLYETVLNTTFDKGNFRKKILSMHLLIPTDKTQTEVRHRPARLYRFDPARYQQLIQRGFMFEL